jgi:hypothetical protein
MSKWEGIRNKSYALPGIDGGELILSETIDRHAIEVTVRAGLRTERGASLTTLESLTVRLNKAQFQALCGMDSLYDGLEVIERGPEELTQDEVPAEVEHGDPA